MVTFSDVAKGCMTTFGMSFAPFIIVPLITKNPEQWLSALVFSVITYAAMFLAVKKWGPDHKITGFNRPELIEKHVMDVLIGVLLCCIATLVVVLLLKTGLQIESKLSFSPAAAFFEDNNIVMALLFLCIIGPITEELFFRGLVFEGISGSFGEFVGYTAASFLYAISHVQLVYAVVAFFTGLIITYFYRRTDCIWVAIAINALCNFIGIFISKI